MNDDDHGPDLPEPAPYVPSLLAIDALHGTGTGQLPREHGLRPSIQVCVALSTLLGLDEQPGELTGTGPIPVAVARRLATDPTGTWRRLVTDPTGWSTTGARPTARPRTWPITSSLGTAPADSHTATAPPAAATSTTNCPGPAAGKPTKPTSMPSAAVIII